MHSSILVFISSWTVASYASEQILGSVHALKHASFIGGEAEDEIISEFNAAPLRMLGKPTFQLGQGVIKALDTNFTVSGDATVGREIRRAPERNTPFAFPPPAKLPLPGCFYNPSGYVCCNRDMYQFIEDNFREITRRPGFNPCNIQAIVNFLHSGAQNRYNQSMEAMVGLDDFAQKVRFIGHFACKLEIEGKYIMLYGTPTPGGDNRRKREISHTDPAHPENEHSAFF